MIGNVIAPFEGVYVPFNPDDCFDPTTHIATEENFMKLLDNGVYDSKYIGYKVQLGNSVGYNNGLWVIADINHDSTNTGQSNCYDLISQDVFGRQSFSSSSAYWRDSNPRSWLNNTLYPGFSSNFKLHILNPKYMSEGTWYDDDYVILPSRIDICGRSSYQNDGGTQYPIFNNDSSRKKLEFNGSNYRDWWLRSRATQFSTAVWYVNNYGQWDGNNSYYTNSYWLAPVLRVS